MGGYYLPLARMVMHWDWFFLKIVANCDVIALAASVTGCKTMKTGCTSNMLQTKPINPVKSNCPLDLYGSTLSQENNHKFKNFFAKNYLLFFFLKIIANCDVIARAASVTGCMTMKT